MNRLSHPPETKDITNIVQNYTTMTKKKTISKKVEAKRRRRRSVNPNWKEDGYTSKYGKKKRDRDRGKLSPTSPFRVIES